MTLAAEVRVGLATRYPVAAHVYRTLWVQAETEAQAQLIATHLAIATVGQRVIMPVSTEILTLEM